MIFDVSYFGPLCRLYALDQFVFVSVVIFVRLCSCIVCSVL